MMTLPSILVSILNRILGGFSDVYVAVLGVYFKLQTFIYMPANGIVQGMRPLVGYNYGAGEKERVKSIIRYSLLSAGCIMLIGTVLSLAIPGQIFALFDAEESLLKAGILALRLISLGFLVSTIGVIYSGVFESLGEGKHSLLISLLRQFIITIRVLWHCPLSGDCRSLGVFPDRRGLCVRGGTDSLEALSGGSIRTFLGGNMKNRRKRKILLIF